MVVATAVGTATVGGFTGAGCWTVSWWLWYHVGVESPTAVGGFTGAGRLARGCGNSSRDRNGWWIQKCWTVSWWLWHHMGVESPTVFGGFTGAGLLAGGCGIVVSCGS